MKSSLAFSILSVTTVLLSFPDFRAEANSAKNQSFEQWCLQKEDLPVETRKTVEVMLHKSGTQDCKLADSKLNSLSKIHFDFDENPLYITGINRPAENQISDIKPIASLRNLTQLSLSYNQISDISPLSGLTKLTRLLLIDNQISDIKPLASLTNLTALYLSFNKISDINPLQRLNNLVDLSLNENQIRNVQPLSGLTNLRVLNLRNNQIRDIKPLAGLSGLLDLSLDRNYISDVTALKGLTNLTFLDLQGNQISERVCPVKPETICNFKISR
jgi:internalin A